MDSGSVFLSLRGSSHSPAPSVDADTLRLLTDKEIHAPSRFRAAARCQRPPGLVTDTLLCRQSAVRGRLACCDCERMTMWQNVAEVGDKGSKLSWHQLSQGSQRRYRFRPVQGNLISRTVKNRLQLKLNRSLTQTRHFHG